ncbi:hypothetical protein [Timonella sp. A28]|uniref:hypothetical protein n=1 Tax=Timonella sp. A28 TaxID=3442640 RepID=UPI003EBCCB51
MLDRRKLTGYVLAGISVIAFIILAVFFIVSAQGKDPQTGQTPSVSTTPGVPSNSKTDASSTAHTQPAEETTTEPQDEAAQATATYESDYEQMAWRTALLASSWKGSTTAENRIKGYREAGMTQELAETFQPVWAEVFAEAQAVDVFAKPDGKPQVQEILGVEGSYIWRVAVNVQYSGTWHSNGTTKVLSPRTATWYLNVDQAKGAVTAIDGPTADELKIRLDEED